MAGVVPSPHVRVAIDLNRVRANCLRVAKACGVPVIAVVKADAYGLGASRVVEAIADLVSGFYVFDLAEAIEHRLWERTGKPTIALHGQPSFSPRDWIAHRVRPAVWNPQMAAAMREAGPVVSVDVGQQRFACPPERVAEVIAAGRCDEAFAHATTPAQAELFVRTMATIRPRLRLHAAGTALLDEPTARLDAVRPGLALYHGAVTVTTPLVEVHRSRGPAGYSGFVTPAHGVIMAGYSNGIRRGPCLVNGVLRRILEVGMQTSFVETTESDRPGDAVTLLGDGLEEGQIAREWGASEQQVLVYLAGSGERVYTPLA